MDGRMDRLTDKQTDQKRIDAFMSNIHSTNVAVTHIVKPN